MADGRVSVARGYLECIFSVVFLSLHMLQERVDVTERVLSGHVKSTGVLNVKLYLVPEPQGVFFCRASE